MDSSPYVPVSTHTKKLPSMHLVNTREQNERTFPTRQNLPTGKRRYWLEVSNRSGRKVRYGKEVDMGDVTLRFHQEGYPVDLGHRKVSRQ